MMKMGWEVPATWIGPAGGRVDSDLHGRRDGPGPAFRKDGAVKEESVWVAGGQPVLAATAEEKQASLNPDGDQERVESSQSTEIGLGLAVAVEVCDPDEAAELAVRLGDRLSILKKEADGWCMARNSEGSTGLVPQNHLKMMADLSSLDEDQLSPSSSPPQKPQKDKAMWKKMSHPVSVDSPSESPMYAAVNGVERKNRYTRKSSTRRDEPSSNGTQDVSVSSTTGSEEEGIAMDENKSMNDDNAWEQDQNTERMIRNDSWKAGGSSVRTPRDSSMGSRNDIDADVDTKYSEGGRLGLDSSANGMPYSGESEEEEDDSFSAGRQAPANNSIDGSLAHETGDVSAERTRREAPEFDGPHSRQAVEGGGVWGEATARSVGASEGAMSQEQAIAVMQRGANFIKFSYKNSKVGKEIKHPRKLWLSGNNELMWKDPADPKSKPKSLLISDITEIRQDSDNIPHELCLRLRTGAKFFGEETGLQGRSFDFEASTPEERDFWSLHLSELVRAAQEDVKDRKNAAVVAKREGIMTDRRKRWTEDILPAFEKKRNTQDCIDLCWLGVPTNLRSDVWKACIGNHLQITKALFDINCAHARRAREEYMRKKQLAAREGATEQDKAEAEKHLIGAEHSLKVLDKDLPRTFARLKFFHDGGPLEQQLRDVLEAFIFYRPDVGYVQGMSFLGAMLLLNMDTYQAFVSLCNLLHSHYFLSFFFMDMPQIQIRFSVFEFFFKQQLPDIFKRFEELGVSTDLYLLNWLMTLFAKSLPLDVATRIWDNYLLLGESFMIRASLGVIKWLSDEFEGLPFEDLMVMLTHLHDIEDADEDEIFSAIGEIKVNEKQFDSVLQKHLKSTGKKKK